MSEKKTFRKKHLFARSLGDVVKAATQPMMSKQGKLYGALLRDWQQIVGPERAAVSKPQRLQFAVGEGTDGATLHLAVRPASAPEFAYLTEQIIEQCARYFGYRAIARIVVHATHGVFDTKESQPIPPSATSGAVNASIPAQTPHEVEQVLRRMATYFSRPIVKHDDTR